jgi:hypothetical protein
MSNATERQCRARNRRGERCAAHVVNAAGYCVAHDPERPANMRELGRKSGEARRRPNPERVPTSLREELRNLDPSIVRGAIEQALAGGNESARVSAVKLLADIDAFRQDGECPVCAEREADAQTGRHRKRLIELLSRGAPDEGELVPRDQVEAMAEKMAQERLAALREEHGIPA